MDILVVDPRQRDDMGPWQHYVQESGVDARLSVLHGPVDSIAEVPEGIVLLGDSEPNLLEWIAKVREQTRYWSVPLVAIVPQAARELRHKLLAAGASAVCDAEGTFAQVLKEIQDRRDARPVVTELRDQLVDPFVTATRLTVQTMVGVETTVKAVYQKTNYLIFGDISAVIGLMGPAEGSMVLSFPERTAMALAERILAGVVEQLDQDLVRDCMGELANVIGGQAKGILENTAYHFSLSTPTVVAGMGHEIRHQPGMPCLVIAFASELGHFALQLCLNT